MNETSGEKKQSKASKAPKRAAIDADGMQLQYYVEENGETPVLILGSSVYYARAFSPAFRENRTTVFADLRHFARAVDDRRNDEISLEDYLSDVDKIRAEVGFDSFTLVGHSHHGNLALEYAKRFPDRVERIALIGSPPCGVEQVTKAGERFWAENASNGRKAAHSRNLTALLAEDAGSSREAFIRHYLADGPKYWRDENYDAAWLWDGVLVNLELIRAFRNFFWEYDFARRRAQIPAPVLVVMGRHDYVVPHTLWRDVLPNVENVTYRLFERSGHTPQLEEPQLFDRAFADWLRKT